MIEKKRLIIPFRTLFLWVMLVSAVLICSIYAEAEQESFRFTKVDLFRFGWSKPTDITYRIEVEGERTTASFGMTESELQPIVQYFGVNRPQDLVGVVFVAKRDPYEALNELAVEFKHKGNYQSPLPEELYDRAARALAKMELPDFSDTFNKDVFKAFQLIYHDTDTSSFPVIDESWLNNFKEAISKYSDGKVMLSEPGPEVKVNPHSGYYGAYTRLILKNKESGELKRLIIGPYSNPFTFETDN